MKRTRQQGSSVVATAWASLLAAAESLPMDVEGGYRLTRGALGWGLQPTTVVLVYGLFFIAPAVSYGAAEGQQSGIVGLLWLGLYAVWGAFWGWLTAKALARLTIRMHFTSRLSLWSREKAKWIDEAPVIGALVGGFTVVSALPGSPIVSTTACHAAAAAYLAGFLGPSMVLLVIWAKRLPEE